MELSRMIGKRRLSPSKAAWVVGDKVDTNYPKSCLRYTVWERRFSKDNEIDPVYTALGAIDETRYATKLTRDKIPFRREVEITHPIGSTGINIEGRIDFYISTEPPRLVEKKSVISVSRTKKIIQDGAIDPAHLAQLLTYMAVSKIPTGSIVITSWGWDEDIDALVVTGEREFLIELTPQGEIRVDNTPYPAHIKQLQAWFHSAATAMNNAEIQLPARPMFKQGWNNPCNKCPLNAACEQYDKHQNAKVFWQETEILEPEPGPKAQIPEPKRKKGKRHDNQVSNSINPNNDSGRISSKENLFGRQVHSRAGDLFTDSDGD